MSDARPAPGKRDPEGRRRAIIAAATEIIVTQGPGALTHRGVAAKAGVALGSTTQYFASLDELRETAFVALAAEIDESLDLIEPFVHEVMTNPGRAVSEFLGYLEDTRTVHADIALIASGATDPRLRELARRWTEKLVEMLTPHVGLGSARAIAMYLDGATVHAALYDSPISHDEMTRAIVALSGCPEGPDFLASDSTPTGVAERPELRRS